LSHNKPVGETMSKLIFHAEGEVPTRAPYMPQCPAQAKHAAITAKFYSARIRGTAALRATCTGPTRSRTLRQEI
jgi:hypothetical protein